MADNLVFLVKVSAEHFRGLVDGMLNFNGNTTSGLVLLYNLNQIFQHYCHLVHQVERLARLFKG